ncbi:MAG: D-tyrosyl-tRNA(Tyr) deacylase [Endomicrobiales bacterium]|nr:D-tyrosyl-tRNA(Tyr) deacylase [Endomicrobiales bacterium]
MKAVIQRVTQASVVIRKFDMRPIKKGVVVLVGVGRDDNEGDAYLLADKIINLRVFPNEEGKFDKSLIDIHGELLVISQFTLYGDCSKGRRPDFTGAMEPQKAIELYNAFLSKLKSSGLKVVSGDFGAEMFVNIHNDGPVTILIDTDDKKSA